MNLFSSPANELPESGRKFVPGLGWIDLGEGLDKYLKDSGEEISDECRNALPEYGWDEVHGGLGQILIGQIVWCLCALLAVILTWLLTTGLGSNHRFLIAEESRDDFWLYGVVFIGLVAAVGYRFLLGGMWRCLLNAPERDGLRWIMFACITGIATSPIFQTTSLLTSGSTNGEQRSYNVVYVKKMKLNPTQASLEVAAAGSVLLSSVTLLLFFRRTAQCFASLIMVRVIDISLLALVPLLAFTLAIFLKESLGRHVVLVTCVEFGWLCWAILHFLLNLRTRHYIEKRPRQQQREPEKLHASWQTQ
jgi:hypothetical protein